MLVRGRWGLRWDNGKATVRGLICLPRYLQKFQINGFLLLHQRKTCSILLGIKIKENEVSLFHGRQFLPRSIWRGKIMLVRQILLLPLPLITTTGLIKVRRVCGNRPWNFPPESFSFPFPDSKARSMLRRGKVKENQEFPMRLSKSRRPNQGQKGRGDVWRLHRAGRGRSSPVARTWIQGRRCRGKMLSVLTLKHLRCPVPYARRFRTCQVLFNKLPSRTAISLLGNMSPFPMFQKIYGWQIQGRRSRTAGELQFSVQPPKKVRRSRFLSGDATAREGRVLAKSAVYFSKAVTQFLLDRHCLLPQPAWPRDLRDHLPTNTSASS